MTTSVLEFMTRPTMADWQHLADTVGLPSLTQPPTPLAGGGAHQVYRLPGGLLARVADTRAMARAEQHHSRDRLAAHLRWATVLSDHSVPVTVPAHPVPVGDPGGFLATVWHDLGDSDPIDFAPAGAALRAFHDTGAVVLAGDPDLHSVTDLLRQLRRLTALRDRQRVTTAEYDLLAPWVGRIINGRNRCAERHPGTPVLVHNDVWPKNLHTREGSTVLLDLDNTGWGPAEHDLGFLVRGVEARTVTSDQAAAFAHGYGGALPDLDCAWTHALAHRFSWVLDLLTRRHWHPVDAGRLLAELPLWARPQGPRPT